jgi:hypothetical protein
VTAGDRINLTQLRQRIEDLERQLGDDLSLVIAHVPAEDVLALIDAVEAAREVFLHAVPENERTDRLLAELHTALIKFTYGNDEALERFHTT